MSTQSPSKAKVTGRAVARSSRKGVYPGVASSSLAAVEVVEKGLPVSALGAIRRIGVTPGELYHLVIPARTLKHRVSKRQRLSLEESDRALRLRRTIELADEIFANHGKAMHWLRDSNHLLGGRAPIDLVRSEVGGDVVRKMLYQIDEGVVV